MLTVGSLFSGIGGIDLGLERSGMKVLWQVEIDPWCRAVLAKHWPDVERFEDVREVGSHNLAAVDVLAGGFPCQDISLAGRGAGISGPRSGLWSEYARLIRELRPRYVLVENVSALLARGLDVVLADLAAIGYDAEWDCIPASAVGAPHRRDRLWLVAYPSGSRRREDAGSSLGDEGPHEGRAAQDDHVADGDGQGNRTWDVADTFGEGQLQQGRSIAEERGRASDGSVENPDGRSVSAWRGGRGASQTSRWWWSSEPRVGRVAHGVPARLDRLTGLGNAVVPQVVEWIGRRIVEAEAMRAEQ